MYNLISNKGPFRNYKMNVHANSMNRIDTKTLTKQYSSPKGKLSGQILDQAQTGNSVRKHTELYGQNAGSIDLVKELSEYSHYGNSPSNFQVYKR